MFFEKYLTAKNIIFFILVLLAIKFFANISGIAMLFFAAYVIASSLNPIVDKLEKKMKRPLAASLVLTLALLVLFIFIIPVIYIGIEQVSGFLSVLPEKLQAVKSFLSTKQIFGYNLSSYMTVPTDFGDLTEISNNLLNQSITATLNLVSGIAYFLGLCVIIYYFMSDRNWLKEGYLKLFPKHMKNKAEEIIISITNKVGGYVVAQITTMSAVGILIAISLAILNVNYAVLLGLICGILDIIPVIGPVIGLVICILMSLHMGPLTVALVFVAYLLAQWAQNNLLRPYIFGKFLDLHPLIILFSLFVTAQFLGVLGVIFAPAIAATVCVLFDELYIKPINEKI